MSGPRDRADLVQLCLQDLHGGRMLAAATLPTIAESASPPLADLIRSLASHYTAEAAEMAALCDDIEGPDNLWMRGIMDDSLRDTRSIARGTLLDVATIGAVRKALAADSVSLDTAICLADGLDRQELKHAVLAMRDQGRTRDAALAAMLSELASS